MKEIYINNISEKLNLKPWQVENCFELFAQGNTIPFISRYRKEKTGGLDDSEVAEVKHWIDVFEEMEKRKATIIGVISALDKLTGELQAKIENCVVSSELEDLYLPYKPKRRTRATMARDKGLEPLADKMYSILIKDPKVEAQKYLSNEVSSVDEALAGARDIIAERISETASVRETLRCIYRNRRIVSRSTKAASEDPQASKYQSYFDYDEPLSRVASHRLLAMLRGRDAGFLSLKIDADPQRCCNKLYYDFCHNNRYPSELLGAQIKMAIEDAYSRLLNPSITTEIIKEYKEKADIESVAVFGGNLKELLLASPVGQKRTLAIDPGYRNGCKVAVLDENGNLLHHEIIYPHPPQNQKIKSIDAVSDIIDKYDIEAIAIGNGTASRETEDFVKKVPSADKCKIFIVSEDGASIYSASEVAREEFPDHDVTVRGAVSIGRRLMDPLSELVKIDPKSLGVGQYQYDVDQTLLKEKLDNTVVSCVNAVGVNLNTASTWLLQYVSGIGPALAGSIVEYRKKSGGFKSRNQLMEVPRLGPKVYEQCAGFLRIRNAENPLDNSSVHPECYHIVDKMAKDLGVKAEDLVGNEELCSKIVASNYVEGEFGLPTINDIINELAKPGLDPRQEAQEFSFAEDIHTIEDLRQGMELPGIVTNITAFGAFVDIGVHENGLIHISQMHSKLSLHQTVKVYVLSVDLDRRRISLRLIK